MYLHLNRILVSLTFLAVNGFVCMEAVDIVQLTLEKMLSAFQVVIGFIVEEL
jgi:hypothetical protein